MCVEPNTRSSVQIPLDIIELIVAEVAFNAPLHQLKNLSLVSHTLKTLCRPYMFRRVVLFFGEWQDPIEGDLPSTKHFIPSMNFIPFTTFLNSNGYAKHIHLLKLCQSEMYRGLFGTPVISREVSMEVISSLVCILKHLVQIKCLDLTCIRWAILPTSVKAATSCDHQSRRSEPEPRRPA